jgi:hypothetical protein
MKTGYQSNGIDLAEIFARREEGDPKAADTEFLVGETDLAELFLPYSEGPKAAPVGYQCNGRDLSDIFAPSESPGRLDEQLERK